MLICNAWVKARMCLVRFPDPLGKSFVSVGESDQGAPQEMIEIENSFTVSKKVQCCLCYRMLPITIKTRIDLQ